MESFEVSEGVSTDKEQNPRMFSVYFSKLHIELFFVAQEKEMEKQRLLYQQARLHLRGASEMVLQSISASKGKESPPHKYQIIKYKCSALLMSSLSVVILS